MKGRQRSLLTPIPLLVELCAGTAALSLRLAREKARPPVSRMGSKAGYADAILRVLGLRPGQGAARFLWCEPDPGCRLLLEVYRTPGLAQEVASIIRKWSGEDPRELWERLRAEGPPRCPPPLDPREVARWVNVKAWEPYEGRYIGPDFTSFTAVTGEALADRMATTSTVEAAITQDAREVDPREVARWARIVTSNRLIPVRWDTVRRGWFNTGVGGTTHGGEEFSTSIPALEGKFRDVDGDLRAEVVADSREVDPREVARYLYHLSVSYRPAGDLQGFVHPEEGGRYGAARLEVARRVGELPLLPGEVPVEDARTVDPPTLPEGTVAYMDPPYQGTTGYGADLPREEVVAIARKWAEAGAWVVISEAEPIPELVADGWSQVEITWTRKGQRRTFSRQQREFLTLSRPPKAHPGRPTRPILGRKRGKVLK